MGRQEAERQIKDGPNVLAQIAQTLWTAINFWLLHFVAADHMPFHYIQAPRQRQTAAVPAILCL